MEDQRTVVTAPVTPRHTEAINYIRTTIGFSAKSDAVCKAIIEYAKSLGWQDPQDTHPPALKGGKR